jgi:glycosyltransferase involved in cell wall biosynthesis
MRILFFLESLHGGGKERRSVELIRYLKQQPGNYEIELVLTEKEIFYEDILRTNVRIRILQRNRFRYDPAIFFKFYSICRNFRPDIIHAWGKMTTFYAIPAKTLCKVPLVSSLIADASKGYNDYSPYHLLLRTNVHFSDVILANSRAGLRAYGINERKARVIYNGADLLRFGYDFDMQSVKNELHVSTEYLVVMVASFSAFKDYDLFLDVAREVGSIRKDVTFVAVGDGPDLKRITRRMKDEKISNVVLAGRRNDVERIVAAADIGVLCTWAEGISNSILEYMALGKPVIATDLIGGSRELIEDGITGYCTSHDLLTVTALVNKLLNNKDLRLRMGKRGKERVERKFSIKRMGDEFQALYEDVLSRKKAVRINESASR